MAPPIDETTTTSSGDVFTGLANVPGPPTYAGHAAGTIVFALDANSNGDAVTYAIYLEEEGSGRGYLKADGTDNGATEVWQTAAAWGTTISAINLTQISYRIKAKARNEALTETAFSAYSALMAPYLTLDESPASNTLSFECTTGNTKVSGVSGSGTLKVIIISYTLTNKSATTSRVVVEYSKDSGSNWLAATRSGTSGDAITGLAAAAAGSAHTFYWQTCTDLGNSYHDSLLFRITPYDASPTGGDAGTASSITVSVDNRPLAVTIAEISGWDWDKDTTPEIIANMNDLICGNYLYFRLEITNAAGTLVQNLSSAEVTAGWYYETDHAGAPGSAVRYPDAGWDTNWTAPGILGVPAAYTPPTVTGNRIRYIVQTALAQGTTYAFKLYQAEVRNII